MSAPHHCREEITYLQMLAASALRPAPPRRGFRVRRLNAKQDYTLGRDMYHRVGKHWHWVDRRAWSDADWQQHYGNTHVQLWGGFIDDTLAGYFELSHAQPESTELAYFGVLPQYYGRGFGGWLLTRAVEIAWSGDCKRVWVHTSSRDHPHALANYLARGLIIYRVETKSHADNPE